MKERYADAEFYPEERSDSGSGAYEAAFERLIETLLFVPQLEPESESDGNRCAPLAQRFSSCRQITAGSVYSADLPCVLKELVRGAVFATRWRKTASGGGCWLLLQKHRGNITYP